jgi:protein-S-isoprenylcysteine O-methyltransferase Ste14
MNIDPVEGHLGNWLGVALWVVIFVLFLAFTPFYKKSQRKPAGVYTAFVVALALEMFGVPLSMYALTFVLGKTLPDGILWGHTLVEHIGLTGTYIAVAMYLVGAALIVTGWNRIYRQYWKKDLGAGQLVTTGIYRFIRHPQYTGFLLITLGMLFEWATLPMLIMYPILVWLYVRLARHEEADMRAEFGPAYDEYRRTTGMFLPRLLPGPIPAAETGA